MTLDAAPIADQSMVGSFLALTRARERAVLDARRKRDADHLEIHLPRVLRVGSPLVDTTVFLVRGWRRPHGHDEIGPELLGRRAGKTFLVSVHLTSFGAQAVSDPAQTRRRERIIGMLQGGEASLGRYEHTRGLELLELPVFVRESEVELGAGTAESMRRLGEATTDLGPEMTKHAGALSTSRNGAGLARMVLGMVAMQRRAEAARFLSERASFDAAAQALGALAPALAGPATFREPVLAMTGAEATLAATVEVGRCLVDVTFDLDRNAFTVSTREVLCAENAYYRR